MPNSYRYKKILLFSIFFPSEKLFMAMADHMAADGFKDAGYQYINIDVNEGIIIIIGCYYI